ncbi:unnamed protein product, partial [Rotaria sp. Silwood2]
MTLFAVLLNCYNADGAFDLFEEIMNVYADPYNGQSLQILSSLLSKSNDYEFPVEQYLDDYENDEDPPHFLDEIDITTDAIIHQSPFNVKACDRIPTLKELIHKEPLKIKPTNSLFSTKIVRLFYKWFAYLPLWSVAYSDLSESETTDTESNLRRGSRHRIPNTKYANDYISPTISPNLLSKALSPKRYLSSSTDNLSDNALEKKCHRQRKKPKRTRPNSSNKQQSKVTNLIHTTTLGSLNLVWPRFGFKNCVYAGESFSVTRTCPIDTGLFALYHAYNAGTDKFRDLFENNTLDAFVALRETFQCVENKGRDVARLHWLVRHKLLTNMNFDNEYDLENTLTKIVFDFVRPMQEFDIRSACRCTVCPKRKRKNSSFDITLRKINNKYPNYIEFFAKESMVLYGESLGSDEPENYPDDYMCDDKFPVTNVETKTCDIDVETDKPLMTELPDSLYIDSHEYRLSAGFNNTQRHFTAVIKTTNATYVRFNDVHPKGCFPYDGLLP